MIDNTLARMIDETLRECLEIDGFCPRKMLEVPVNQAHLEERRTLPRIASNPRNFVRDLFTIGCLKAFA
jgi:hypothetical protein